MSEHRLPERDRPWVMRTYAGHSDARRSNELYRRNLAKGQTGLSVAFDLPTQTGYDPDHVLARGEVGKVGVSIVHKGDMHTLLDGIPLDEMNTSMTINATAAWLLALYVTVAEENGVDRARLKGTTQNDIIKEYLSRGTYAFPPGPSMRLIADTVAFSVNEIPSWNPTNICSYHLQEAGATPVQEIAYALSTGIAVLDEVKARGQVAEADFPKVFGRISFFVNAGIRLIEEIAKLRAMGRLWNEIGRERYGVTDEKMLRFRYGVQVNSLGLTEAQPENNVQRIVLEMLGVTLSRDARARSIQLPAWNEALGLPRPWDQQWALRMQQVLAYETDLLEYPDLFEGSKVVEAALEAQTIAEVQAWRSERDSDAVKRSLDQLRRAAESGDNIMPATIDLAHAGGTTGEWAGALREVFGEYRAPTGVAAAVGAGGGSEGLRAIAERVKALPGGPPRLLVAKPGLDGHSSGAEQIAVAARDAGLEVIYQGIRLTPEQIAAVAVAEDVEIIGLSILSGSHLELVPEVVRLCRERGVTAPVIAGGIIPEDDRPRLLAADVAAVYTPKDFALTRIMG